MLRCLPLSSSFASLLLIIETDNKTESMFYFIPSQCPSTQNWFSKHHLIQSTEYVRSTMKWPPPEKHIYVTGSKCLHAIFHPNITKTGTKHRKPFSFSTEIYSSFFTPSQVHQFAGAVIWIDRLTGNLIAKVSSTLFRREAALYFSVTFPRPPQLAFSVVSCFTIFGDIVFRTIPIGW